MPDRSKYDLDFQPANYKPLEDSEVVQNLQKQVQIEKSKVDPQALGGLYLPELADNEVEIASISLDSTTGDVISVLARFEEDNYHYRVVDEYESEFIIKPEYSPMPLSMGELIELIDTVKMMVDEPPLVGLTSCFRNRHLVGIDEVSEEEVLALIDFVHVRSDYYSQLEAWYIDEAREWAKTIAMHN